jgi:hypothetical protein
MHDAPERGDAAPEDRGHAPEAASSEEVREMSDPDGVRVRVAREGANRKRGRERAGGAHSESLTDRELVGDVHGQRSRLFRGDPPGHVLGDGPRPGPVTKNANATARARNEPGLGPGPELEDHPGPHGAAAARVTVREVGPEDPGDVAGGERTDRTGTRDRHRPRPSI